MADSFVKVDTKDVDAKVQDLVNTYPTLAGKALFTSAMSKVVPQIKRKIRANRSIFRGELHQRTTARVGKSLAKGSKVRTASSVSVNIGSIGVPYGINVEKGSPPQSASWSKIIEYVRKKMGLSGDQANSVAAAIIKTIEDVGTIPHPFLIPTWEANKELFFKNFIERMKFKGKT